jgi:hypothetical protein
MAMGLIDDLRTRIDGADDDERVRFAGWRDRLAALRAESRATDAELARALRRLAQGRPTGDPLEEHPAVRMLAHLLFIEPARVAPRALIAVPILLDLVEAGRGTLEEALSYAESVTSGVS